MKLRMTVRDCLYLNWALPVEGLPELAPPLRYQVHSWQGRDWVFASALMFHQEAIQLSALPILRVGYPQFNLRLCVLDGSGIPSVLFRKMLMPKWVAPGVRLVSHQPASSARLDFPRPSACADDGPWQWRVECGGAELKVRAWRDTSALPTAQDGPRLGSWDDTLHYFQDRPHGYAESSGELHRVVVQRPPVAVWPLRTEIVGLEELLPRLLLPNGAALPHGTAAPLGPALHSAWLCPEIPFVFETETVPKVAVSTGMPQPAAGRVVSVWRARESPPAARRQASEPRRASC